MFWEKWIPQKYLFKSSVCGIEVLIQDSALQFYGTLVKKEGQQVKIAGRFHSEQKPSFPAGIKKNKIPLMVCVTGKGLINKKVSISPEALLSPEEILAQNLPTIQSDEFYVQLHRQENQQDFLSVIRKAQLDPILELLRAEGHTIAGVLIGPAFISGVGPFVSHFNSIQTLHYLVEFANNSVDTLAETFSARDNTERELNLQGIMIRPEDTLGFAGAYVYLAQAFENSPSDAYLSSYPARYRQAGQLRVLTYFFITMAFLICLINFFLFTVYFDTTKKLETQLNIYQGKYEQINELLSSYEKQKGLIERAGVLNKNCLSGYSDKIAATVPQEVILTEWTFNPLKEDTEEDSLMTFQAGTILIRGNCNKSLIINEWLNVLKSQNFIKDINLEKFSFNTDNYRPNFELKILTN